MIGLRNQLLMESFYDCPEYRVYAHNILCRSINNNSHLKLVVFLNTINFNAPTGAVHFA